MKPVLTILTLAGIAGAANANLVLNGGFETNTAGGDMSNMSNALWTATVANSTAYGPSGELDLYTTATFLPLPCEGHWKAALHTKGGTTDVDAFTLDLSGALTPGQSYTLSFCAVSNNDFGVGNGELDIGVSTSATGFGTWVYNTGVIPIGVWTTYTTTFVAPDASVFLSVSSVGSNHGWNHVDDFQLDVVPEPASICALGLGALALLRRRRR